jgi:hypothetical protein
MTNRALLDVAGAAGFGTAGVLSGEGDYVQLSADSAIEFASGQITTIAQGASLTLFGNNAFIEDGTALGSNSALTGLSEVAGGSLTVDDGASVSTNGSLINNGNNGSGIGISLDAAFGDDGGGSSLTVGGTLTNNAILFVGNAKLLGGPDMVTAASLANTSTIDLTGASGHQALFDVTTGAAGFGTAGTVTGEVDLAGNSAIEFAGGQISTIAGGLTLDGNDAFVEDSTALGSNSALTGLSDVSGGLFLGDGAAVSTTGPLANSGSVILDYQYGRGGSTPVDRRRPDQRRHAGYW